MKEFKSGFIAVLGLPNVGKSTLINHIVGQKVAIISDKPQTTRNRIIAIHSTPNSQMIFIDTPGIHKPHNKLGEYMVNAATGTVYEADIVLFITSADKEITNTEKEIIEKIKSGGLPSILVINKIDKVAKEKLFTQIAEYNSLFDFEATIPISAKTGDGVNVCTEEIEKLLEPGPEFYPADMVTDVNERGLAAEIIREKMLNLLDQEIPHGVAVEILTFKKEEKIIKISANIYCEKESHKGIIIGKKGEMLKKVGMMSRIELETMLESKVFLELWVKVKDDWRNNDYLMKSFGFDDTEI